MVALCFFHETVNPLFRGVVGDRIDFAQKPFVVVCQDVDYFHFGLINQTLKVGVKFQKVIDYLISVVDDPKVENIVTDAKKLAAKNYDTNKDYESLCNADLKNLLETAK